MIWTVLSIIFGVLRIVVATASLMAFEKNHTKGDTHSMIYNAFWVIFALGL